MEKSVLLHELRRLRCRALTEAARLSYTVAVELACPHADYQYWLDCPALRVSIKRLATIRSDLRCGCTNRQLRIAAQDLTLSAVGHAAISVKMCAQQLHKPVYCTQCSLGKGLCDLYIGHGSVAALPRSPPQTGTHMKPLALPCFSSFCLASPYQVLCGWAGIVCHQAYTMKHNGVLDRQVGSVP